ncbi:DUF983 domain-containing protein [Lacinutrix sp. C3R15]|uniref:DUF983 domain-containing protein n=1 Tax=Flavobacteriaceae TaxID=49546 RepID=UPI001C0A4B63|nr:MULTISPECIES: DUF983 domain-containing protein [Flavobacteriaceae]MBU2939864.1 DUF983 domain-containing protein [Lacinutrix sp. C3R15]MDO6623180.1 DUF983 domain-containing protein [Oceanihabitans sp. 1_MG-2023]
MFYKDSKLYSILTGSCPKCHQESMYTDKNPYHLSKTLEMNEQCSHCHTKYEIEPSFFYGAMYVSYAVGVAFAVAAFVISAVFFDASRHYVFISIIGTLIVFAPVIMRLSRNIWINFFMHYDKNLVKKK